jgi:serine/threonine-protein kinase
MATVHLGRLVGDGGFGRTVAIKRLHPHCAADPRLVLSFLDEAWLATRIRHPNVVATLDVVAEPGEVFLVMDYVDGESLSALVRCSQRVGVPPSIAVGVVAGVLRGLHAAHEAVDEAGERLDLVHRDVSPQNILVGVDGIPRLLDFGIAKAQGRRQTTQHRELKGKLSYMAPEQLTGVEVTRRTDLFAVGIVLWELLAGRRLFRGEHEGETVTRALMAPVVPPSRVSRSAPAALDAVVLRALERDPSRRFTSAEEMVGALEATMSPAAASVVGEWVRRVASDSLEERVRQVRAIEKRASLKATRSPPEPPSPADSIDRAPLVRRLRVPRLAAVAVVAVVVATEGAAHLRGAPSPLTPAAADVTPSTEPLPPTEICAPPVEVAPPCSLPPPPASATEPSKTPSPALENAGSATRASKGRLPLYSRD